METIQINGVEYVSTREIEKQYGLTRKKAWQEIQKINAEFITIALLRFYPVNVIKPYFDSL